MYVCLFRCCRWWINLDWNFLQRNKSKEQPLLRCVSCNSTIGNDNCSQVPVVRYLLLHTLMYRFCQMTKRHYTLSLACMGSARFSNSCGMPTTTGYVWCRFVIHFSSEFSRIGWPLFYPPKSQLQRCWVSLSQDWRHCTSDLSTSLLGSREHRSFIVPSASLSPMIFHALLSAQLLMATLRS